MTGPVAFWVTVVGFTLTYAGLGVGKVPGLRVDRAGIAAVGAAFFLSVGLITFPQAVEAVDHATLVLLFGMMVVVAFLRLAGFFERLTGWVLTRLRHPLALLAATVGLSGVLSAFLVNDVVCVALTPLVLQLCRQLRLDPLPHLMGLATAANIGSSATITGNPQNMIIGSLSHIPYLQFTARLAPVALVGLLIDFLIIACVYRRSLRPTENTAAPEVDEVVAPRAGRRPLLIKSLAVTLAAVVLFFAGLPVELVALGAAAVLLLDRVRPAKVYQQVDWPLLVMFAGLFVVVRTFELNVVRTWGLEHWEVLQGDPVGALSVAAAVLSNVVSNVPAVLLFRPVLEAMPEASRQTAWLALAMSSTLAGNLTVLGSVANLIVVELARREGVTVTFWEYAKAGVLITAATLAVGVGWLLLTR